MLGRAWRRGYITYNQFRLLVELPRLWQSSVVAIPLSSSSSPVLLFPCPFLPPPPTSSSTPILLFPCPFLPLSSSSPPPSSSTKPQFKVYPNDLFHTFLDFLGQSLRDNLDNLREPVNLLEVYVEPSLPHVLVAKYSKHHLNRYVLYALHAVVKTRHSSIMSNAIHLLLQISGLSDHLIYTDSSMCSVVLGIMNRASFCAYRPELEII